MSLIEWSLWALLAVWLWLIWPLAYGLLLPRKLRSVPVPAASCGEEPLVSIIVPARDEAAAIEPALRSLLRLDYPRLEIIAVNDRSSDETGAIMERVCAGDPRCHVIHVAELPAGWLGKNHANALGAARARGDYLLFTDGDVTFAPEAIRRAVTAMQRDSLDHLAVVPDTLMTSLGEQLFMNYFIVQFSVLTRMWITRLRRARRAFVGIGAFNMLRREAYEAVGRHEQIAMEVADDLMLGRLVKDAGFHQDVLLGEGMVRVKWQTGLWGLVRGLEKNAFAGARYSVPLAAFGTLLQLAIAFGPPILVITGPARLAAGMFAAAVALTYLFVAWRSGYRLLAGGLYPLASVIFCYVMATSTGRTLRAGGVWWRDTFYPLAELRAGMIQWQPLGGFLRARCSIFRGDQKCGPAPR